MDRSLPPADEAPQDKIIYGVIRCGQRRHWWGWPATIDYATVSAGGGIVADTMMVQPTLEWLRYKHVPFIPEAGDAEFFEQAIDARAAALTLNNIFGHASVYEPDLRASLTTLYKSALVRRTWSPTSFFFPFQKHDVLVGPNAVFRMVDKVPEELRGVERVRAHAEAFVDLSRAHHVIMSALTAAGW